MTTPYDARRTARLREAYEALYHLGHVVKDYPNVRKDGFGNTHLDRIEKLLAETTAVVTELCTSERRLLTNDAVQLVSVPLPEPGTADGGVHPGVDFDQLNRRLRPEQTVPASLIDQLRTRTDCD